MTLNAAQVEQLLAPINPRRVLQANGQSHVSQQDVTAHLIRVFGFGGFDTQILTQELIYETNDPERKKKNGNGTYSAWDVAYKVTMRLTIKDEAGKPIALYENGSTGSAIAQPQRDAAHDLAFKSAISLATKRCAINLGDQFGLSLYNKGQVAPLVQGTKVMPEGAVNPNYPGQGANKVQQPADLQADVQQQESMGIDETYHENTTDGDVGLTEGQQADLEQTLGAQPIGPREAAAEVGRKLKGQSAEDAKQSANETDQAEGNI